MRSLGQLRAARRSGGPTPASRVLLSRAGAFGPSPTSAWNRTSRGALRVPPCAESFLRLQAPPSSSGRLLRSVPKLLRPRGTCWPSWHVGLLPPPKSRPLGSQACHLSEFPCFDLGSVLGLPPFSMSSAPVPATAAWLVRREEPGLQPLACWILGNCCSMAIIQNWGSLSM